MRVASPIAGDNEIVLGLTRGGIALPDRPHILNIAPVAHDPEYLVHQALDRDLTRVNRLRFDPVNRCNLACVFCPTTQIHRHAQIGPDALAAVLRRIPQAKRIIVGCSHEPLMAKNLDDYAAVIRAAVGPDTIVSLTTNGMLLHRRSMGPWARFLSWLWISVASHRQETLERIEGDAAEIGRIEANIGLVRYQHPALRVHLEFVANSLNRQDAAEFVDWAFGLGVSSVNVRRVGVERIYMPGSYLEASLGRGLDLGLTDTEWEDVAGAVTARFPAHLARCSIAGNTGSRAAVTAPVLELTADETLRPDE